MPQGTIKKAYRGQGVWIHQRRGWRLVLPSQLTGRNGDRGDQVGQAVTYEEGRGPKGPRAEKVKPL